MKDAPSHGFPSVFLALGSCGGLNKTFKDFRMSRNERTQRTNPRHLCLSPLGTLGYHSIKFPRLMPLLLWNLKTIILMLWPV